MFDDVFGLYHKVVPEGCWGLTGEEFQPMARVDVQPLHQLKFSNWPVLDHTDEVSHVQAEGGALWLSSVS